MVSIKILGKKTIGPKKNCVSLFLIQLNVLGRKKIWVNKFLFGPGMRELTMGGGGRDKGYS